MPAFAWTARDSAGRRQTGRAEAPTADALVGDLRGRGWLVLDIEAVVASSGSVSLSALRPSAWLPIRSLDVEIGLQQISVMLRSGVTLLASLQTVAEQATRGRMQRTWQDVAERIQQGTSLADALERHRCFGRLVVQLVRVGEQTGALDLVLARAADTLEQRRTLRTSLVTAMMYPGIVFVAAIGVAAFMLLHVIPRLEDFLKGMGKDLPAMTQLLVDISAWLRINSGPVLGTLGGLLGVAIAVWRWPPGRLAIDRTLLRLPLIGPVLRLAGTITFARAMAILLRSGVSLTEALRTARLLHSNHHLARCVEQAREHVVQGGSLSGPLAGTGAFMPMLSRMVAVGESSGTLDDVLDEVTRFHESWLQATIRRFSALVEPAVILVVGTVVGFVYIAFFMALFAAGGAA